MSILERIPIDPNICHSKPCIRGMRWTVEIIIDLLGQFHFFVLYLLFIRKNTSLVCVAGLFYFFFIK